jgi:hypothetical protein
MDECGMEGREKGYEEPDGNPWAARTYALRALASVLTTTNITGWAINCCVAVLV